MQRKLFLRSFGNCTVGRFFLIKIFVLLFLFLLWHRMQMTDTAARFDGGFDFEIFTHHTLFWNFNVVLLGQFNRVAVEAERKSTGAASGGSGGSGTGTVNEEKETKASIQVLVRRSPTEFVKVILEHGRVVGVVLIGKDTEDAETWENLILNRIDVSGIDLLNHQLDLADYFD